MNNLQPRRERVSFPLLDRDLDNVFEGFFRPMHSARAGLEAFAPAMDVTEHDDRFVVHAELPGFAKDDIDISLDEGRLTIAAESSSETTPEAPGKPVIRERRYGKYMRALNVGRGVDSDAIKASYVDGVLEISLPKIDPEMPVGKRITVD